MNEKIEPWERPGLSHEERQRVRGAMYIRLVKHEGTTTRTCMVLAANHGGEQAAIDDLLREGWRLTGLQYRT